MRAISPAARIVFPLMFACVGYVIARAIHAGPEAAISIVMLLVLFGLDAAKRGGDS